MSLNLLDHFLLTQLAAFLFIFCRIGSALMVMPAFGDMFVSPRTRLLLALAMSALLTPILIDRMPPFPASTIALGLIILCEVLIGAFIGMLARTRQGRQLTSGGSSTMPLLDT